MSDQRLREFEDAIAAPGLTYVAFDGATLRLRYNDQPNDAVIRLRRPVDLSELNAFAMATANKCSCPEPLFAGILGIRII
ncbi:MAG: hypothetical protein ABSE64_08055 [Vulcanimicrobiaceae bacterium]